MRALAILLCIGSVLSRPGCDSRDQKNDYQEQVHNNDEECYHIDFLQGLTQQAISDYYKIAQNTSQSIAEIESALNRWARKYDVEDKYRAHEAAHEKEYEAFKRSLIDLTTKLSSFFKSYVEIGNDKTKSYDSMFDETQVLYRKLNNKEKMIVTSILQSFGNNEECSGNSGVYPESNGGYPGNNGGYPGNNGGYPGYNGGYSGNNGGYPGNNGGYPGYNGGYSGNNGGYPGNNGGYPGYNGGYSGYNGGYPGNNGGYPGSNGGYPGNSGSFPGSNGRPFGNGIYSGNTDEYTNNGDIF